MKRTTDYTAIVRVKKTGFTYAYAFMSESNKSAKDFANWKFDQRATNVVVKKGAWTIEKGKAKKL